MSARMSLAPCPRGGTLNAAAVGSFPSRWVRSSAAQPFRSGTVDRLRFFACAAWIVTLGSSSAKSARVPIGSQIVGGSIRLSLHRHVVEFDVHKHQERGVQTCFSFPKLDA